MEAMVLLLLTALSIYPATQSASYRHQTLRRKRDYDDWELNDYWKNLEDVEMGLGKEWVDPYTGEIIRETWSDLDTGDGEDQYDDGGTFINYFLVVVVGVILVIMLCIMEHFRKKHKRQQGSRGTNTSRSEQSSTRHRSVFISGIQPNTIQQPRIIHRSDAVTRMPSTQHEQVPLVQDHGQESIELTRCLQETEVSDAPPPYHEALDTTVYPNVQHKPPSYHENMAETLQTVTDCSQVEGEPPPAYDDLP